MEPYKIVTANKQFIQKFTQINPQMHLLFIKFISIYYTDVCH